MKLFTQILLIGAFLFSRAALAVAADDSMSDSAKLQVSTGKYITGGVLGSTVGFGIGHAVQGRYSDKGWIFTAGEAVGLTLLVAGANQCQKDKDNDPVADKCSSNAASQVLLGFASFVGFHIWEVVDVWTGARPIDEKTSIFVLPAADKTTVGWNYNF